MIALADVDVRCTVDIFLLGPRSAHLLLFCGNPHPPSHT